MATDLCVDKLSLNCLVVQSLVDAGQLELRVWETKPKREKRASQIRLAPSNIDLTAVTFLKSHIAVNLTETLFVLQVLRIGAALIAYVNDDPLACAMGVRYRFAETIIIS